MATLSSHAEAGTAHDFTFTAIDGSPLPLSRFAGRALLVVNTASRCGFTGQYDGLQRLWQRYRDRGLTVLGVPSNDFGSQEPGTESDIQAFCATGFGIDFPMTAKVHVRGPQAHPFYRWAGDCFGLVAQPRWNFHKFLFDAQGRPATWFSSFTSPTAGRLVRAVEAALPKA